MLNTLLENITYQYGRISDELISLASSVCPVLEFAAISVTITVEVDTEFIFLLFALEVIVCAGTEYTSPLFRLANLRSEVLSRSLLLAGTGAGISYISSSLKYNNLK